METHQIALIRKVPLFASLRGTESQFLAEILRGVEIPAGTTAWLDRYPVQAHHHVRLARREDLESLARRLTGHAVGLVLSGGAARGWAHTGVLRALDEAGIGVDLIGGTSMGAILGATCSLGLGYQAQLALAREFSSPLKLFDPTVPVVSIFASKKVTQILRNVCGDTQIEDLWRPFFCVSSASPAT
jgi:hypothetical protein